MPPLAPPSLRQNNPERHSDASSDSIQVMDEDEDAVENILFPDPIFTDGIARCTECVWEVVDGLCQGCGLEHNEYDDAEMEHLEIDPSTSTQNDMLHPDRRVTERGDTPLREVDPAGIQNLPDEYYRRQEMYKSLLARGATCDMCLRYDLQFYPESGIIAWADEDLMNEFTGELVKEGDRWQICLGRRVTLDPNDKDGSVFMTELVEEAAIFQRTNIHEYGRWETILTHLGKYRRRRVWITRPILGAYNTYNDWVSDTDDYITDDFDEDDAEFSEGGLNIDPRAPPATLFNNDNEDESEQEDEGMDVDPSYSDGEIYEHNDPEVVLQDCAWDSPSEDGADGLEQDMHAIDSDEPGSDWDSDEIMSGDEINPYIARLKELREEEFEEEEEDEEDDGEEKEERGDEDDEDDGDVGREGSGTGVAHFPNVKDKEAQSDDARERPGSSSGKGSESTTGGLVGDGSTERNAVVGTATTGPSENQDVEVAPAGTSLVKTATTVGQRADSAGGVGSPSTVGETLASGPAAANASASKREFRPNLNLYYWKQWDSWSLKKRWAPSVKAFGIAEP